MSGFFLKILALLPLRVLYFISDIFAFTAYRLIRYRKEVVIDNLTHSLPSFDSKKINELAGHFYSQFFQVWFETVKGFCFSKEDWNRHVTVKNLKPINDLLAQGQSVILLSGHSANWEWSGVAIGQKIKGQMTVFYKPLRNSSIGNQMLKLRQKSGVKAVPKDHALRYLIKTKEKPQLIGMIADQCPVITTEKYWVEFLDQKSAFYKGAEKFSRAMKYPVFYSQMKRQKKGRYLIDIIPVYDGKSELPEGQVIKRYAELLQRGILNDPSSYLWSHKRWKYTMKEAEEATERQQLFIS